MKLIIGFFSILFVLFFFIGIFGTTGCAVIVPPSGGLKDTLPPVLLSAVPQNQTLKFNGKLITFTFDEYVQLADKDKNLIINPPPKSTPTIEAKLKTITIRLRDTLQPNTTYSIDFGNSLRDINEGNILKNFVYVFSTGKYIDSMELSGRVLIAMTGKPDSTLSVILHSNLADSAVSTKPPRYIAKLDSAGGFTFHNLAPGTYNIYALKAEGGVKEYTSKSQVFAFADSPVVIKNLNAPVMLYAYAEEAEAPKKPSGSNAKSNTPPKPADKDKRLKFQVNTSNGDFNILDTFSITFATPLKSFDSTKLHFMDEQFADIPAAQYKIVRDTSNKKVSILYKWPVDTKYHLIAEKEFAEDTLEHKLLKIDTINIHTKRESEYAEVHLRFRNLNMAKHPVLQFIQGETVKYSHVFKIPEFKAVYFLPGEYELRILYDDNQNGIWDPGNFEKRLQPEKAFPVKIPNKKKLNIKANWDNDIDFTL
ncbi:MAG: Ig-like domain-containing protein [Bacteroidetes bacterium]|nr:Ig-like domain-containing protein [Bacteroidota bacterium]